ncbi:hypothetical protein CWI38_0841p0010 [Hamiltosporidium tvaerminnensis]|uniref:Leucine-rich repeat-containing protein n=1 Tax=Hamiltosporidium tvaerminnensis TaxID=1176355 RepID=A0A4Q9LUA4_9MICR|nr:hypothetical protein CWI38_0841p0010 [Hamiltosporidium tvaerminnensis]
MYISICFRRICSLNHEENIEMRCLRKIIWMIAYSRWIALLYFFGFLKAVNCTSRSNNGRIKFALIDMNWRNAISKQDLAAVEYWMSRSNSMEKFCFCYGKHFFQENKIYPAFFICTRGLSFLNHEPLHIFEVNYVDDWKIKFRILDDYLVQKSRKPFLFKGPLSVSYQLFNIFVTYLSFDSTISAHNLSYELFYKFLKLLDLLDPISSVFLNKFYSNLYKNGLMKASSFDIINDDKNYRLRYFCEKRRKRPFMYFFGVLNNYLGACLIPDISTLSVFKKRNQHIDQCFRYTEEVRRLVLKISVTSLELLICSLRINVHIFDWLLFVTKIAGYYIDDTEYSFNPIKFHNICGFVNFDGPIKTQNTLKVVSSDFFLNLSDVNQRRITYLRFVNVDICFDLIKPLLNRSRITFLEISYCNIAAGSKITDLSEIILRLNVLKLRDFKLRPDDIYLILHSKIKVLILSNCTLNDGSVFPFNLNKRYVYEIAKNLRMLDISSSKLPMLFVQFLCFSSNLENMNISCFEFLPEDSFSSLKYSYKKFDCLEINHYIPNDSLKCLLMKVSANSLSLCFSNAFNEVIYFFRAVALINSVKYLDLSDNILPSYFLNLVDYFKNLKRLKLSSSLPLYMNYINDLRIYNSLTDLDLSRNNITTHNYTFIPRFINLKSLNLMNTIIEKGLFRYILSNNLTNSLISLDISNVVLRFCDFKRILYCKKLKIFHFKISSNRPLSYYCDILSLTMAKNNLSILTVELETNINFDDILSLADFHNLLQVKITCNKFIGVGEEDLIKFNFKNPEFRFELVLKDYNLDINTVGILMEIFNNYSCSFVSL